MSLQQESRRIRWSVMLAAWAVAGGLILLDAAVGRGYVALLDAQGLRGAEEATTPLRQVIPARYGDAQMWVRHVLDGQDTGAGRVRFTTVDNAPAGRDVHWASGFGWLLRGAAAVQESLAGPTGARALERALLWLNAPLFFAVVLGWSAWTARRLGIWAGALIAVALAGHQRFAEPFAAAYADHHGAINAALLGLVLGAAFMGFGWWRPKTDAGTSPLPGSIAAARRAAIVSAVCGALAMWLSAAAALPVIALLGVGGVGAAIAHRRGATAGGAGFEPGIWRLWGRTGAMASAVCYLVEYAPAHLGWRLEVIHPLYSVAWWGGAECVAMLATAAAGEPTRAGRPRLDWRKVIPALLALAAPPTAILFGGAATFLPRDPFVADLRHFVVESRSVAEMVREFGLGSVGYDLISALILVPAVMLLWRRRDDHRLVLGALTLTCAAFLLVAFLVVRWWVVGSVLQVALLLWIVASASDRPARRGMLAAALAIGLFLGPASFRIARDHNANRRQAVGAIDLYQPLYRDLAATVRATQPDGPIILLASPNASAGISYFGRFQSLGTLFWENAPGLRAAAEILCAEDDEDAFRLISARGVTHVVMLSAASFLEEYFSLLHPGRSRTEAQRTFGSRVAANPAAAPRWLQPIPYRRPAELGTTGGNVSVYKVVPALTEDQRWFHLALAQIARGETELAEKSFLSALALVPPEAQASLCSFAGESAYQQGEHALAVRMLRRSLRIRPEKDIAVFTAWILATSADPAVRDGVEALALVKSLEQGDPGDPVAASTLAAAYAEVGRFDDAVQMAERALASARRNGDGQSEALLAQRLAAYRTRRPWRQ